MNKFTNEYYLLEKVELENENMDRLCEFKRLMDRKHEELKRNLEGEKESKMNQLESRINGLNIDKTDKQNLAAEVQKLLQQQRALESSMQNIVFYLLFIISLQDNQIKDERDKSYGIQKLINELSMDIDERKLRQIKVHISHFLFLNVF
jgi:hypothetical protein